MPESDYSETTREARKRARRAWRERNRQKVSDATALYLRTHPEKARAASKRYYDKHRDEILAKARAKTAALTDEQRKERREREWTCPKARARQERSAIRKLLRAGRSITGVDVSFLTGDEIRQWCHLFNYGCSYGDVVLQRTFFDFGSPNEGQRTKARRYG